MQKGPSSSPPQPPRDKNGSPGPRQTEQATPAEPQGGTGTGSIGPGALTEPPTFAGNRGSESARFSSRRAAIRVTRPGGIDPALTEPHLANRFVWPLVVHFQRSFGASFVEETAQECGLSTVYLQDTEGWVSFRFAERFASAIAERLHGRDEKFPYFHPVWQHWRIAGRSSILPEFAGVFAYVVRALGSPAFAYGQVPSLMRQASRLTHAELVLGAPGLCVLRVEPASSAHPDLPCSCWNRVGLFEGLPTLWGLPEARVDHPICMHQSPAAPVCEYRITYQEQKRSPWLPAVLLTAGGLLAGLATSLWLFPGYLVPAMCAGALVGFGAEGWRRTLWDVSDPRDHASQLLRVLEASDARYDQLWAQQRGLRRALLVNRKIAGYLSPELIEQITEEPEIDIELGGRATEAAVLFADIVGFTCRCEHSSPREIVDELNLYFSFVDPVISRHNGVIDKRIGDGIMVVFATRDDQESPADTHRRAVRCAIGMLRALEACNRALKERQAGPMEIRIGLAAGSLVLGNMGSDVKLEYTVIGDVVNVASRLEGLAKPGHILMASGLLQAAPENVTIINEREVRVKGRDQPVQVVELLP